MERSAFQQGAQYLGLQARAGTADSFEKLIQDMFAWSDAEVSSNMGVLFPQGLQHTAAGTTLQQQQQQQQQVQPAQLSPLPPAAAAGQHGGFPASPPARSSASSAALTSPFSGLSPELLLGAAPAAARPPPAAAAAAARHTAPAAGQFGAPGSRTSGSSSRTPPPQHSSLLGEENLKQLLEQQVIMQRAQEALLMQQQIQQQQQQQVVTTELQQHQQQQQAPCQAEAAATAAEGEPCKKGRRGRPPKADGQYTTAYAALKKYRARKRNELEEMEAAVAAKLAQLAALQQENQALKNKQEALESTIVIQERVVAQLSALQVAEQQQQQQDGAAGAGSSNALRTNGGSSNAQQNAAADVSALLAAVTGEPQTGALNTAAAAEPDLNNPAGDEEGLEGLQNPDWAGITNSGSIPAQRIMSGPQLGPEQLDVFMLLDRYRAYVAACAAALQQLAMLLPQQQPGRFTANAAVPPAAVGCMTAEEAAALGVAIPPAPFRLSEFLALGNDERLPPALPAINLLTGKHESIEPQIWRVVASQLTLRPGQAQKLAAAWGLYSASLIKVNNERGLLMRRLQEALDTCHRSSAAADAAGVGLSEGGLRSGLDLAGPNDSALLLSDEKLLDDVLNQHEYWDLAEAIDANMAREDQVMILFDYAIFMLMDELQLAQVVVSSWPFFPLMGSICTWLLEGEQGS